MAIAATETGPQEAAAESQHKPAIVAVDDVGKGTGLGLETVRSIIEERHRGTIEVESRPGRTTFRIWLPLADAAR